MRTSMPTGLVLVALLLTAAVLGGLLAGVTLGGETPQDSAARPVDKRLAPYAADPEHLWNRLHRALFVRSAPGEGQQVHSIEPLLYRNGSFLLEGEPHRTAVALLDQFLAGSDDRPIDDPPRRLLFQRDLWAAFDYAAWYPDDWVHHSRHEPAAVALRDRLARAIGSLALADHEIAGLPDNYTLALKSKQYADAHDPEHPGRPFLPADLFDPTGSWVRFHDTALLRSSGPMAEKHFEEAGGRAVHVIFLRLPDGRAATEGYLKELKRDSVKQFPPGTMVAMVRRALAVDASAKVRVTPVTELVQIRVYRRIPEDPRANFHGDFGEQDVYEFVLDRAALFAGQHGLRSVEPGDLAEPFARYREGAPSHARTQLKSCIQCHQAPGIHSVTSMQRALRGGQSSELFRTFAWDVEMRFTVITKVKKYNWGLLQGKLEVK